MGVWKITLADMKNDLNDIIHRVEKLEQAVLGARVKQIVKPKKESGVDSLSGRILELRNSGFFKQPKAAPDVRSKLQPTYPCEPDRVTTALLRLRKNGQLRITSKEVDGKKLKAYVW